jgi:SAM-dependent methyltransferase
MIQSVRAVGLLRVAEIFHFLHSAYRSRKTNEQFLRQNSEFKTPSLWWMHDMYAHTSYPFYVTSGAEHAGWISEMIDKHVENSNPKVAEWGCGLGRLTRHMPDRYTVYGFDYNVDAINWCRSNFSNACFLINALMPPLPAGDQDFDALFSVSVFTHLSKDAHKQWIEEIARVLAPNGILLASFHGERQAAGLLNHEQKQFTAGDLVVRAKVPEGSRIFVAYHPEAFVRELLAPHFDIIDGPLDALGQTVWIARKRSCAASSNTEFPNACD